jgi:hypothetical protein
MRVSRAGIQSGVFAKLIVFIKAIGSKSSGRNGGIHGKDI